MPKAKIVEIDYQGLNVGEVLGILRDSGIIVCLDSEDNTAAYVGARGVNKKALRDYAKKVEKK